MGNERESQLRIMLRGPGWSAELAVERPRDLVGRPVTFPVTWSPEAQQPREIQAAVLYTTAQNRAGGQGWRHWHVKIYRCAQVGEADALRQHLRQQAVDILRANAALTGAGIPIVPPWGVVPVQIVRGDAQQDDIGTVLTELGVSAQQMFADAQQHLPSWFVPDPMASARTVLAISPFLDRAHLDDFQPIAPAVEHLRSFAGMAAGLDALHRAGTVHCDIKPDNVCRVTTTGDSSYVLIDTDAATRINPPPRFLRTTRPYVYAGIDRVLRSRSANPHVAFSQQVLLAQDRFGFALVVLSALAGREWVAGNLLWSDDGHSGARKIDERELVVSELSTLWPDTPQRTWQPLIAVLAEPFGQEIEAADWTVSAWVERLIAAERACLPSATAPDLTLAGDYAADLDLIRQKARDVPLPGQMLVKNGYRAVELQAQEVAARVARRYFWGWAAIPVTLTLIFAFGALVLE